MLCPASPGALFLSRTNDVTAPADNVHVHPKTCLTKVPPLAQWHVPPLLPGSSLTPTSTIPETNTLLWRAHRSTRRHHRRPRRLAPSRAVFFLSPPHAPPNDRPKSSKISNALSFFPIKDASGTTQLVVRRNKHNTAEPPSLSHVPVESSVLITGRVSERPEKDRRQVSAPRSPLSPLTRPKSSTGDVEVQVDSFTVLNPASPVLPFYPSDDRTLVRVFAPTPPRAHRLPPTGQ